MTRTTTRLAFAALAVGALTLVKCGDDDDTTAGTESSTRHADHDQHELIDRRRPAEDGEPHESASPTSNDTIRRALVRAG